MYASPPRLLRPRWMAFLNILLLLLVVLNDPLSWKKRERGTKLLRIVLSSFKKERRVI